MKNIKISLMGWMLIGLTLVGLLPFVITAYQIQSGREGLVEQVQQTHLVSVLATADRISSYFELLNSIADSAAKNPNLFQKPDSIAAQEILIGILRANNNVVAASIIQNTDAEIKLVQSAQSKEHSSAARAAFINKDLSKFQLVTSDEKPWLLVTQQLISNPRLSVRLLTKRQTFEDFLNPPELSDADLGIFTRNGQRIAGQMGTIENFPDALRQQIKSPNIRSSANNFNFRNGTRAVASFAQVNLTDWVVVSRQPASKAELATQQYIKQAVIAFSFVFLLALILAWAARKKIIKPIQELVAAQQQLAGIDLSNTGGSEIEQLKISFAQLEQNINDRQKLNKMFLGRYQVIDVIASGAMGTVFKGYDPRLERDVALKTIKIGKINSEFNRAELAEQLVKEAKLVAKLPHPNIVTVYDAVDADESALVAMEFIDGMSLAEYLSARKSMPVSQVTALAIGMLRGLGAAHKAGIIHRDIKPGNILIGYDGGIKLTDFGIADLLSHSNTNESGQVVGTPGYVAPELLEGAAYSTASDLFAMGVLLYRCATQVNPFSGRTLKQILQSTLSDEPKSPRAINERIPTALSNAILYLLQKNPIARPSDADLIADALEKEFGAQKWVPPIADRAPNSIDASTTTETRMLPETIIRKHMKNLE